MSSEGVRVSGVTVSPAAGQEARVTRTLPHQVHIEGKCLSGARPWHILHQIRAVAGRQVERHDNWRLPISVQFRPLERIIRSVWAIYWTYYEGKPQ